MTSRKGLESLLTEARRVSRGDITRQRVSFVYGNANIESNAFSHATVTMMVPPEKTPKEPDMTSRKTDVKYDRRLSLESLIRQYNLMTELIVHYTKPDAPRFVLSPKIILDLQAALVYPGGPQPGYRSLSVRISTNDFEPMAPEKIPEAIEELCSFVNDEWETKDALTLASFALWKLNWIHPFVDGNGRTARSLSYLILCTKLGTMLPGAPTIPEQLRERRGEYFDALVKIDITYQENHEADVSPLCDLLHDMLLKQLEMEPALSEEDISLVRGAVDRRARSAHEAIIKRVYGREKIAHRLWSIGSHLVLQVGPEESIIEAEDMLLKFNTPFPKLLVAEHTQGALHINKNQKGLVVRDAKFEINEGKALSLDPDSAVILENPKIIWRDTAGEDRAWQLQGVLYIIRYGKDEEPTRAAETFDFLLARHMATSHQ